MTAGPESWQLEATSPELYERYLVPAVTLPWAVDLVERAGVGPGASVLDVACGTGAVARVAAARVGDGRVVGLDVNEGMLAVARAVPQTAGLPIDWVEGSALAMPFVDREFDIVLCQLGLQFVPDRPSALREMRRVLRTGGRIAASVFSAIARNPAARAFSDALDHHLGDGASRAKRAEHSLADVDELRSLFAGAGFGDVRIETVVRTVRFASAADWVRIQLVATPLATLLADRELSERRRLVELVGVEVGASLAPWVNDEGLAFPQEVHVALATA